MKIPVTFMLLFYISFWLLKHSNKSPMRCHVPAIPALSKAGRIKFKANLGYVVGLLSHKENLPRDEISLDKDIHEEGRNGSL